MASSGASACTSCDCPPGQIHNGCGGTSPGVCESCGVCPPGEIRLECVGIAAGTCVASGIGKYKASSGTNLCVSCEAAPLCPSKSYRSGCGGDSEGACADCGGCPAPVFRTECEKVSKAPFSLFSRIFIERDLAFFFFGSGAMPRLFVITDPAYFQLLALMPCLGCFCDYRSCLLSAYGTDAMPKLFVCYIVATRVVVCTDAVSF